LTATVTPSNATNQDVSWESSNESIATVSSGGLVTAVATGSATITVTTDDGEFTDDCAVTVTGIPNVALGSSVIADSNHGASAGASAVVDGDTGLENETRWVSANTSWPHWLEIDLGGSHTVSQLKWWSGSTGGYGEGFGYRFQYWDGSQWIDILTETSNTSSTVDETFTPVSVSTGFVRLYGTGGTDNIMRVFEIEVYGVA